MWCSIILILFVLLVLAVVLLDFFSQFYTWQSRIKIGRIVDRQEWVGLLQKKSLQWLKHTPTIKLTDNTRLIIIDILRGNYKRKSIQSWQQASLLLGLTQSYVKTKDPSIKNQIDSFLLSKINSYGAWITPPKEIDEVLLAYALLQLPLIDIQKYKPCFDATYALILDLKGSDGTIAYKRHHSDYRFVDTIGFICPFLMTYGVVYDCDEAVALSLKQILTFNNHGMLGESFIPCHTYRITDLQPAGLFGWGRGLGWYAIGLIDAWNALPDAHPDKHQLTNSVIAFAKMALSFQNEDGSYHWLISDTLARKDSSTTATMAWFFINAAKLKDLSEECYLACGKAENYLKRVTRRDGAVDFSQGDTKAIGIYSREFDILPFTQGFVLRTNSI